MKTTTILIFLVTLCTISSQLLLKSGATSLLPVLKDKGLLAFVWSAGQSPTVVAAVSIQAISYILWIVVVSQEKLSVAFATTGAFFYLLTAIVSWQFLNERPTTIQWIGLLLVSTGAFLLTFKE